MNGASNSEEKALKVILIKNGGARNPNSFQILNFQYLSLIANKVKGDTGGLARTVIC